MNHQGGHAAPFTSPSSYKLCASHGDDMRSPMDGRRWLNVAHMFAHVCPFSRARGDDHSRCTTMSPALITADLQTRLIAGCATANKIDSRALPEGIETAASRR
jgi:hypothetical protein